MMKTQRHSRRLTTLAIPIAGAALLSGTGYLWFQGAHARSAQAQQATDAPQRVHLTPTEREAILREMRTMMRSLNSVLHALADGKVAMMEQAARASGKAIALDPQIEKTLPVPYGQLDQKIHLRFDQLADAMKGGTAPSNVVPRLAAITGYCVACHEMFRSD